MPSTTYKPPSWGFVILLIVIGVAGTIGSWRSIQANLNTSDWPQIDGQMMDVSFEESQRIQHGTFVYESRIIPTYTYTIDGNTYQNERISMSGKGLMRSGEAKSLIEEKNWYAGYSIDVYVNPNDPSESVLLKDKEGVSKNQWISIFFFGFLLFSGIIILVRDKLIP